MEVKLRKSFYGTKIAKVSSDSLQVSISFNYQGPAQTLNVETNTGKRGLFGDYDQESPTYYDSKAVSASDTPKGYTFSRSIPLSFWGTRQIDDCAVEVVIRGEGVYDDAVLWDAYTVNLVPVGISFQVGVWGAVWGIPIDAKWTCYYWDPGISAFVSDKQWYNSYDKIKFSNVKSGGYLVVYLLIDSIVSPQYTSPVFQAVNGGSYIYDVQTGVIY